MEDAPISEVTALAPGKAFARRSRRNHIATAVLLALSFFIVSIPFVAPAAWAQTEGYTTIALSGDTAPGGNGTFQLFGTPTINANGQVVFGVALAGTQPADPNARGVYLGDGPTLTELVRVGDPAPDGNGSFALFSSEPNVEERFALNASGTVAFNAQLEGTTGGFNVDDAGLFVADATSGVTQLVRLGDAAPDGNGVFGPQDPESAEISLLPPGLDAAGGASFFGVLFETSGGEEVDDRGVFHADAISASQLARIGSLIPGTSESFNTIQTQIASNAAGEVALVAEVFGAGPGPPGADFQRIYVDDGTTFNDVVRSGTAAPDGDGTISNITDVILSEAGEVIFQASVNDTMSVLDAGVRAFRTDGTTLSEIARHGALGPGEAEFEFTQFVGIDANGQGQVALSAVLERPVAPPGNRTTAIYLYDEGVLTLLRKEGDPAPGGNGTLGDLAGPVFLNENGAVAFFALLDGTSSPPNDDAGIFVIQPNGTLDAIVRRGQALAGSTVNSFNFLGAFVFDTDDLALAGMTALNDAGQVAFVAALADLRSGVFVNVPEPSAAALGLGALAPLGALARRRGRPRRG